MDRLSQLKHSARNALQKQEPPHMQNTFAAYLSSRMGKYIPLQQAIEICVAEDTATQGASGTSEAYEAVATGIEDSAFISNAHIAQLLESNNRFIGIKALEALALKLENASERTLQLFVQKALEQVHEVTLASNLYRSINGKLSYSSCSKTLLNLLKQLENYLRSSYQERFLETYPQEQRSSIELPEFNVQEFVGLVHEEFTHHSFRELRELKKLTRKQVAFEVSRRYKPVTEKTIYVWENAESPLPKYAIEALLGL